MPLSTGKIMVSGPTAGGFEARISTEIRREMWEKWILLAALGGVTCLMRGAIGEVEAAAGGAEFARQFLDEVVAVVRAAGVPPSEGFVASVRERITAKGSPLTSSMYRDLRDGRRVEYEQIIGDLCRLGHKAQINTPRLAAAYAHLDVYARRIA